MTRDAKQLQRDAKWLWKDELGTQRNSKWPHLQIGPEQMRCQQKETQQKYKWTQNVCRKMQNTHSVPQNSYKGMQIGPEKKLNWCKETQNN